jgi:hypothetical protein
MKKFDVIVKHVCGAAILGLLFSSGVVRAEENSHSGLFVEPLLTYELETTKINYPPPLSDSSGSMVGLGLGARLGFQISEIIFVAGDFRYSLPQFKDSSVSYDARSVATNFGPVVGIQMPHIGVRVWGTYLLAGELNPERSGSIDVKFSDLKGYRVGAGFRIQAVSVNLELQQLKYGVASLEQLGPFSSNSSFSNVNLESNGWIASVSFPLESF